MSGFIPVPRAALDITSPEEWIGVTDLYRRAHAVRWGPLKVTERSLATRWRLSSRRVWGLLDNLASAGLLTIERGGPRSATTLTVVSPVRVTGQVTDENGPESGSEGVKRSRQRSRQHISADSKGDMGETVAQVAALTAASLSETRDKTLDKTNPVGFDDALALWLPVRAAQGMKPRSIKPAKGLKSEGGSLVAICKKHSQEDIATVFSWLASSSHKRAQFYRDQQLSLVNVRPNFGTLLDLASNQLQPSESQNRSDNPAQVWASIVSSAESGGSKPMKPPTEADSARFWRAVKAAGGKVALYDMDRFSEGRMMRSFIDSYTGGRP